MQLEPYLKSYTPTNHLRIIKDLNVKLLEENIGENLLGNDFLVVPQKVQSKKAKMDKLDYIQLESLFLITKETTVKSQPTKVKKIFANYISDKELISQI